MGSTKKRGSQIHWSRFSPQPRPVLMVTCSRTVATDESYLEPARLRMILPSSQTVAIVMNTAKPRLEYRCWSSVAAMNPNSATPSSSAMPTTMP